MKRLFVIFFVSIVATSTAEAQNPTALWKCRDSLSTLQDSASVYPSIKTAFEHIDAVNEHLKKITSVFPFASIWINVLAVSGTEAEAIAQIRDHMQNNRYEVVAIDSSTVPYAEIVGILPPAKTRLFSDTVITGCIEELHQSMDPEIRYARSLVIRVYCEISLAHLAYAMREYRNDKGGFSLVRGLLIVRNPVDKDHMEKILRVFDAEGKISLP